ncbi:hypothetical protein AB4Y96_16190 [Phyllobacterium sp. TAF24]|uniref:hypothetical protein n=1 Tax=Phyllobacterium sp. TAF24 TaxID=3233068 RepID=UPI003F99660E
MKSFDSNKVTDITTRFKGAALVLVGGTLLFFAIENYIKVTNATIGTYIRIPRILEWSYDKLGFLPSVALHAILAVAIILFGLRMLVKGKPQLS